MGLIFGGSTTQNEQRIEELEQMVKDQKSTISRLERREDTARGMARNANTRAAEAQRTADKAKKAAEENARAAFHLAVAYEQYDDDLNAVTNKSEEVETLEEPRVAWKATRNYIVKLLIPEGATVVHPKYGSKKRTDKAVVLELHEVEEEVFTNRDIFGNEVTRTKKKMEDEIALETSDNSRRDSSFTYEVGEMVTPEEDLNKTVDNECCSGIHFFTSIEEAVDWYQNY